MATSKIITREGKTMLAALLKAHVKQAAFTVGDGLWADTPETADFELAAADWAAANNEIGRVPVLAVDYLIEDAAGPIQFDGRKWAKTAAETNVLQFEFLLDTDMANGSSLRQIGFFGDVTGDETEPITGFVPWMAPAPAFDSVTAEPTGGTLVADHYYYVVVGRNARGRTMPSMERAVVATSGTTRTVLTFTLSPWADQYEIYRGHASGALSLLYTSPTGQAGQVVWVDDGSLDPDGVTSPPVTATARSLAKLGRLLAVENIPAIGKTSDMAYRRFLRLIL